MQLPQNMGWEMAQNRWASILNPWLKNPMSAGVFVKDQALILGVTVINHKLGRTPQGWMIVDIQGVATIYRSAAFNDLTLTLTSSAAVTASLYVF